MTPASHWMSDMQRYRINYHWLIGVFVASLVLAVTAYFVWSWQVNRKAGYFLRLAEAALAEEDPQQAFDYYRKYVQLRPDEVDARIKMGGAAVEVIEGPNPRSSNSAKLSGCLTKRSARLTTPSCVASWQRS